MERRHIETLCGLRRLRVLWKPVPPRAHGAGTGRGTGSAGSPSTLELPRSSTLERRRLPCHRKILLLLLVTRLSQHSATGALDINLGCQKISGKMQGSPAAAAAPGPAAPLAGRGRPTGPPSASRRRRGSRRGEPPYPRRHSARLLAAGSPGRLSRSTVRTLSASGRPKPAARRRREQKSRTRNEWPPPSIRFSTRFRLLGPPRENRLPRLGGGGACSTRTR